MYNKNSKIVRDTLAAIEEEKYVGFLDGRRRIYIFRCKNKASELEKINGMGVITLDPGCVGKSKDVEFRAEEKIKTELDTNRLAMEMTNLTDLDVIKVFANQTDLGEDVKQILVEEMSDAGTKEGGNIKNMLEEGIKLQVIARRARKLSENRKKLEEERTEFSLIKKLMIAAIGSSIIFGIVILSYGLKKWIDKKFNRQIPDREIELRQVRKKRAPVVPKEDDKLQIVPMPMYGPPRPRRMRELTQSRLESRMSRARSEPYNIQDLVPYRGVRNSAYAESVAGSVSGSERNMGSVWSDDLV